MVSSEAYAVELHIQFDLSQRSFLCTQHLGHTRNPPPSFSFVVGSKKSTEVLKIENNVIVFVVMGFVGGETTSDSIAITFH